MSDAKKDLISGLLFLGFGILICIYTSFIQDPEVSMVGPRVFPYFIGICMIVLSLVLVAKTLWKSRAEIISKNSKTQTINIKENKGNELRALMIAVICMLYAALFSIIGYFASTFFSIVAIGVLLKEKRWFVYVILFAVAVIIWAGFTYLLRINLP